MKVAIIGSDNITNFTIVEMVMNQSSVPLDEVITTQDSEDEKQGVAFCVRELCKEKNIPCKSYFPKWDDLTTPKAEKRKNKYTGKWYNHRAGVDRNQLLIDDADAFIVIWDGRSAGVADIIRRINLLVPPKPTFFQKVNV